METESQTLRSGLRYVRREGCLSIFYCKILYEGVSFSLLIAFGVHDGFV